MGRFETELLATDANIEVLAGMNGALDRQGSDRRPPKMIILDMDSSVSPTHGNKKRRQWSLRLHLLPSTIPVQPVRRSGAVFPSPRQCPQCRRLACCSGTGRSSVIGNGTCAATSEGTPPLPHRTSTSSWKVRTCFLTRSGCRRPNSSGKHCPPATRPVGSAQPCAALLRQLQLPLEVGTESVVSWPTIPGTGSPCRHGSSSHQLVPTPSG